MHLVDRIKMLCDEKGINISALERAIDAGNGTIRRWSTNSPSIDRLNSVAEYFGVSVDYLLGKTERRNILSEKDERDIAKDIEKLKEKLKLSEGLMFDGEPATEEAIQSVLDAMAFGVRQAKIINKKYTPKKYLKNDGDFDDKN